jgi:hypothetical protein
VRFGTIQIPTFAQSTAWPIPLWPTQDSSSTSPGSAQQPADAVREAGSDRKRTGGVARPPLGKISITCGERKMSMRALSNVANIHSAPSKAPVINGKLLAWAVFAGVLVVIALYAMAVSPPPDVEGYASMALIGP